MSAHALMQSLGKAIGDLDAAILDAQRTGLMSLKPKIERVMTLQRAFNVGVAKELAAMRAELDSLKGGADG